MALLLTFGFKGLHPLYLLKVSSCLCQLLIHSEVADVQAQPGIQGPPCIPHCPWHWTHGMDRRRELYGNSLSSTGWRVGNVFCCCLCLVCSVDRVLGANAAQIIVGLTASEGAAELGPWLIREARILVLLRPLA